MHLQAERAIDRFDYAAAMTWLDRSRVLANRNAETELLAARVARRQGSTDAFQQYLQQARRLGADEDKVRLEELLAIAQTGAMERCEEELIAYMVMPGAETDEISDAYSNGLAAASRFEDAMSVLSAWALDYPDDPRPPYRTGRLLEHQEQWDESEAAYRLALQRNAEFYPARFALGRVLLTGRRVDEAAVAFRDCLTMPNPLSAQIELAACYRAKGDPEMAKQILREVLASDYETILASYQAVEDIPDYFEAAVQLGDLEAEAGNSTEAVKWFRLALDKNSRDLTARYGMALALRAMGRTEDAEKEFAYVLEVRKALEKANPLRNRIASRRDDLEARLELGELLLQYESEKMGLFWIRSIFTYDSKYAPAHQVLAKHYRGLFDKSSSNDALAQFHERAAAENTP